MKNNENKLLIYTYPLRLYISDKDVIDKLNNINNMSANDYIKSAIYEQIMLSNSVLYSVSPSSGKIYMQKAIRLYKNREKDMAIYNFIQENNKEHSNWFNSFVRYCLHNDIDSQKNKIKYYDNEENLESEY